MFDRCVAPTAFPPLGKIKHRGEKYTFLFPHTDTDWNVGTRKRGAHVAAQHAVSRIETKFGFPNVTKLLRNLRRATTVLARTSRKTRAVGATKCYSRSIWPGGVRHRTSTYVGNPRESSTRTAPIPSVRDSNLITAPQLGDELQKKENEPADSYLGSETSETELSENITHLYDYVYGGPMSNTGKIRGLSDPRLCELKNGER